MFRHGPSPGARLLLYLALALFLMVADTRLGLTGPLRSVVASLLYPLQWLAAQPVLMANQGLGYFQSVDSARSELEQTRQAMAQMTLRAGQAELLLRENAELRELLALRQRLNTPTRTAQVLYDTPDPYTRRVIIDQGRLAGVAPGSPVMDAQGVLGQVTRVDAAASEITLLIDRDQAIPVLNVRTGARSVAYGNPLAHSGGMELRFTPGNADVQQGDLLTTSGIDGVYPPGLPVARVVRVERRADSTFARIDCEPLARVHGARHVMVLDPVPLALPEPPAPAQPRSKRPKTTPAAASAQHKASPAGARP